MLKDALSKRESSAAMLEKLPSAEATPNAKVIGPRVMFVNDRCLSFSVFPQFQTLFPHLFNQPSNLHDAFEANFGNFLALVHVTCQVDNLWKKIVEANTKKGCRREEDQLDSSLSIKDNWPNL